MSTEKETGGPAFPHALQLGDVAKVDGGMNLRQYAAIKLRVPDSGTDWLDEMILASKRDELAAKAIHAIFTDPNSRPGISYKEASVFAHELADTMLEARK